MNTTISEIYQLYLKCGQQVCTDTRKIIPNSIFFALKGNNFDGNLFAIDALQKGCTYAIVDNQEVAAKNEKCILVENVLNILQTLAHHHRKQLKVPVIAITGSNGKTTTKELVSAVLSQKYKVLSTPGNFNNHIGLPLTLLQLKKEHQIAIIEMGANHPNEIKELCEIAEPDYGIITSIGKEHLEGFGNIDQVKKTNGELYEYLLEKKGKIFLHIDNPDLIDILSSFRINITDIWNKQNTFILYSDKLFLPEPYWEIKIIFGQYIENTENIFVQFKWLKNNKELWQPFVNRQGQGFEIASAFSEKRIIKTHLLAYHNFINALSAVCIGNYFDVPEEKINTAVSSYIPDKNRMQWIETNKNNKIILDAYNANPTSMLAALKFFKEKNIIKAIAINTSNEQQNIFTNDKDKLLILGDMFELGEYSEKEHTEILQWIQNNFLDTTTYLIGKEFCKAAKKLNLYHSNTCFITTDEFIQHLSNSIYSIKDKFVLIKASRGMQLEKIISYL